MKRGVILFVAFGLLLAYVPQTWAIPAFARKYKRACTTCHTNFPKLKNFGIAFKNRGYRMEDEKGVYIWKIKEMPLAAVVSLNYANTKTEVGNGLERSGQFNTGADLELFAGGTLAPGISYFIDGLATGNRALVQFDDIMADSAMNLKVGDFNVDNYFISRPRRLTATGYLVEGGVTFENRGVELNGQFMDDGFRYIVGLGNDSIEQTDASLSKNSHSFGNAYYGIVNQSFSGHTISLQYRKDRVADGAFAQESDTHNYGVALEIKPFKGLTLDGGVYYFTAGVASQYQDEGDINFKNFKVLSGTVEASFNFTKKWLGVGRYDWHNTLNSPAKEAQYVASLQYYAAPNVKIFGEGVFKKIQHGGPNGGVGGANEFDLVDRALIVGVVFGF